MRYSERSKTFCQRDIYQHACSATNSLYGVSSWTSFVDPQKSSFLHTNVTYSNTPCSNKIYLWGFYPGEICRLFFFLCYESTQVISIPNKEYTRLYRSAS